MARGVQIQKKSTKLTRAQKTAASIEKWAIINELKEKVEELKTEIESLSREKARLLRKTVKLQQLTSPEGIREFIMKQFKVNLPKFDLRSNKYSNRIKLERTSTPIDHLFPNNQGVATSVFNNMLSMPEGLEYWQIVVKTMIAMHGEKTIAYDWISMYFDAGQYEESGYGYVPELSTAQEIFKAWEREIMNNLIDELGIQDDIDKGTVEITFVAQSMKDFFKERWGVDISDKQAEVWAKLAEAAGKEYYGYYKPSSAFNKAAQEALKKK